MYRFLFVFLWIILPMTGWTGEGENPVSVAGGGWTISAWERQNSLCIEHDRLGIVLKDVRLTLQGKPLKDWLVEKQGNHQIIVTTKKPQTTWFFDLNQDSIKVSCTSPDSCIIAKTPIGKDRLVARIMDSQGVPVTWTGTGEVAAGYGGNCTRNPSFLPSQNPECMYFALGSVSSSIFHNLFDRTTDTIIRFSDQTLMKRNIPDENTLDITMPVPGNTLLKLIPNYYTKTLGLPFYVPFDDSIFSKAPMVWCSWTSYYSEVTEQDIISNTDWLSENLKPYGFEYVQVDDGYDRGLKEGHYWIEHWDRTKFPHGPQWLTNYIKSKGLHPGLWLVPNAYAGSAEQHPDWYLRDKNGKIILDYNTPALDSTNPEVREFLKQLFSTLGEWGFEYYKFDGEHALPMYVPSVDRNRLHDQSVDLIAAYRNRLALIRDTIGPKTFVEGCPAGTPLNGIGYFNSYFNGQDVYNNWQGMYALFSSINANAFLNHIVVYVMPGEGMEVGLPMTVEEAKKKRPREVVETARTREEPMTGFGVTAAEARTLVSFAALSGVVYPLASVMPELPQERLQLLQKTLPTMPIFPIDLFSRGTDMDWDTFKHVHPDHYIHNYPEILDLKVNAPSGVYDVAGLINWRSEAMMKELTFKDKLGLDTGSRYIVFDFWNQKLLGVFSDRISVDIEPHDTRVLLLHPLLNRPQLIGNSRHITGACSILNLSWDDANKKLCGSSETIPGEDYRLSIYVPDGVAVSEMHAAAKGSEGIPVHIEQTGKLLVAGFTGRQEVIEWQIKFTTETGR